MKLKLAFTFLTSCSLLFLPAVAVDTSNPKKYPNLDATTWIGTNFYGKKYEVTFHAEDYPHRSAVQPSGQGVLAGKVSFVTNPDQPLKACLYYFEGPAEQNHHDPDYRYNIRFAWDDTWAQMHGVLLDDEIHMDNVEPATIAIDPKMLFGKDFKSDQGLQGGVIVTDGGQEVSYQIEFYGDIEWAQRTLETALDSGMSGPFHNGNLPTVGPSNLGNCSFYQHTWSQPSKAPVLSFVRDNVLIHVEAHSPDGESPQAIKSMLRVAYKLDSAIHEGNPAVSIVCMPKTLTLKP